ncbi:hypothetical protein CCO03_02075 [Comamonas serinivorans]|uniref:Tetratricopeptide repeat protein n=1 Tax=Comamonas serinivorans TaxID=1082851 RepID=A0A1Y0EJ13_9BURK|nr:tetratricopeptide repeat protein [Comamonas serinivorans]ARU03634.1 hypothetical protein CCO03_02075 [Comamonas serinivorans]
MHTTATRPSSSLWVPLLLAGAVLAVLCVVYGSGLHNALIFDDARLRDGIVAQYGLGTDGPWRRWLSYASFAWLGLDEGRLVWQRGLNLLLHVGVCLSLYALFMPLVDQLPLTEGRSAEDEAARRRLAVLAGVAVFALNPVAVYAVAYLIQRSIVLATLCAVLACACWVRGLLTGHWAWLAAAAVAGVLAVLSKEHALLLPLVWVVLLVHVRRPPARTLALAGLGGLAVLGLCGWLMWGTLGHIVGAAAFDETSAAYVRDLEALRPGFAQQAYGLSVFNQAALFFVYGGLWLVPNPGWLAIDLRPAFPLGFASLPHLMGALAFVALFAGSVWVLLRRRDGWSLAAVCVLSAQLLFGTEFVTTWLQDPFVLYRSYLWAAFLPGLVALALLGLGLGRAGLLSVAVVVGLVSAALAFERVQSLRSPELAWGDAAAKVNLQAPVNAVGRWRPFLNHGAELLERGRTEEALKDFEQAVALGEPLGAAAMSQGMALQVLGRHAPAVAALERSRQQGMKHPMLAYHLGLSQRAIGELPAAVQNLQAAAAAQEDPQLKLRLLQDLGETALAARQPEVADQAFAAALALDPGHVAAEVGRGMVLLARQQAQAAMAVFDASLARRDSALGHYGQALAHMALGNLQAARSAVARAQALDPNNRNVAALARHLQTGSGAR